MKKPKPDRAMHSVPINEPIQQLLLLSEPILSVVEEKMSIESGSLQFVDNAYVTYENDPSRLSEVKELIDNETKAFSFFVMKIRFDYDMYDSYLTEYFEQLKTRQSYLANVKEAFYYEENGISEYYFYSLCVFICCHVVLLHNFSTI